MLSGEQSALRISVPISDHVPELMYSASSLSVGTAMTAEPVSWVAGSTTLQLNPTSFCTSAVSSPSTVPGVTIF